MTPRSYSGDLEVEDDAFSLCADSLILRDSEIAFHFSGRTQEYGPFESDGKAPRIAPGCFEAINVPVTYRKYGPGTGDAASLSFVLVRELTAPERCEIQGKWTEGGGTSKFWGMLDAFSPSKR